MSEFLTPEQERQILRFMQIIRECGGYGTITLEVRKNEIRSVGMVVEKREVDEIK